MGTKLEHGISINNHELRDKIKSAKAQLYNKLTTVNLQSTSISEYNQWYLGTKLASLENSLELYSRLIYLSLENSQVPLHNTVLVDYGGGSGLISMLAAEVGVGSVIYNDIYDVSCKDVVHLSDLLKLTLDHVICGDVDELVSYLNSNSISINSITSYDVLEHIYDIESHFKVLNDLSCKDFRIVYASGANIENPRRARALERQQVEVENKDREKRWGSKERDTLEAYLNIRKNIISAYAPDLNTDQVEYIAYSTRGLIQKDIEGCVDEFRQHGNISYNIAHPTNTCDPYTGNWCEHLIELEWLERTLSNEGFSVEIMTGRYNTCGSFFKKSAKIILNTILRHFGRRVMSISPYYVLYAHSTG